MNGILSHHHTTTHKRDTMKSSCLVFVDESDELLNRSSPRKQSSGNSKLLQNNTQQQATINHNTSNNIQLINGHYATVNVNNKSTINNGKHSSMMTMGIIPEPKVQGIEKRRANRKVSNHSPSKVHGKYCQIRKQLRTYQGFEDNYFVLQFNASNSTLVEEDQLLKQASPPPQLEAATTITTNNNKLSVNTETTRTISKTIEKQKISNCNNSNNNNNYNNNKVINNSENNLYINDDLMNMHDHSLNAKKKKNTFSIDLNEEGNNNYYSNFCTNSNCSLVSSSTNCSSNSSGKSEEQEENVLKEENDFLLFPTIDLEGAFEGILPFTLEGDGNMNQSVNNNYNNIVGTGNYVNQNINNNHSVMNDKITPEEALDTLIYALINGEVL
ncbi:hypothetical protein ABK040_014117 [Willaertia magna]